MSDTSKTFKVECKDGHAHYVMGLSDSIDPSDPNTMLVYHYPEGDIDTRMRNHSMMHAALYDLVQCDDRFQSGDRFETEFGSFRVEGYHVISVPETNALIPA